MNLKFLATLAIASVFAFSFTGCTPANNSNNTESASPAASSVEGNPCAGKTNPCAGKTNPCAGKNTQAKIYTENQIAIDGTDPVAYFKEQKPVAGNPEFNYEWMGATWHFSSAENRDLFTQNPEQYAPQYGGYCAKAVSEGSIAPTSPDAWTIYEGKLYLNYDKNVQAQWQKDIPGNIAKADKNWPGVLAN